MYVRLKKRKQCQAAIVANETSYSIVVVESVWTKDGNPRQKFLQHLGSIRESQLKTPSAYNDYIAEIMRWVPCSRKGIVLIGYGYCSTTKEEFEQMILDALHRVAAKLMG